MTQDVSSVSATGTSSATKDRAEFRSVFFAISFTVEMLGVIGGLVLSALNIHVTSLYCDVLWINLPLCLSLGIGKSGSNKIMDMIKKGSRKFGM